LLRPELIHAILIEFEQGWVHKLSYRMTPKRSYAVFGHAIQSKAASARKKKGRKSRPFWNEIVSDCEMVA